VKVVITGDGGDESFAGYPRYARSRLSFAFARVPPPLRRMIGTALRLLGTPEARVRQAEERAAMQPAALYARSMRVFDPGQANLLIHPDRRASAEAALADDPILRLYDEAPAREWLDRLLYTDLKSYLAENVLAKVDRMTMAHGIEARSPLLDHRLVELSSRLPAAWKRSGGQGKRLLRSVASELLPREVIERPKRGFDIPVRAWMRSGPLREQLERDLAASELVRDGWLDAGAVGAQLRPHDDGDAPLGNRLWSLCVLELWYRQLRANDNQQSSSVGTGQS
jgi:asparagine synthase (glutamine-hydrolysing)